LRIRRQGRKEYATKVLSNLPNCKLLLRGRPTGPVYNRSIRRSASEQYRRNRKQDKALAGGHVPINLMQCRLCRQRRQALRSKNSFARSSPQRQRRSPEPAMKSRRRIGGPLDSGSVKYSASCTSFLVCKAETTAGAGGCPGVMLGKAMLIDASARNRASCPLASGIGAIASPPGIMRGGGS
jgi:hypothetical protein